MATTLFKFEKRDCVDAPTLDGIVKMLKAEYKINQGDEDKAGSVDDAAYHEGRKDAIKDILYLMGWEVK